MTQDPNASKRGEGQRDTSATREESQREGSTRPEGARGAGSRGELQERQRGLETTREGRTRESGLVRRSPLQGTMLTPFGLMRAMADDIERLFGDDLGFGRGGYGLSGAGSSYDPWRGAGRMTQANWAPQLETFRRENQLVVRADLPGMSKDDINIEVEDNILSISGERSDENRDERDDYYRSERTYGRFFRAIQLPDGVDAEKVEAQFKDGVLEVTIPAPKVQQQRNRQVKIR